jgi:hypothetical protein
MTSSVSSAAHPKCHPGAPRHRTRASGDARTVQPYAACAVQMHFSNQHSPAREVPLIRHRLPFSRSSPFAVEHANMHHHAIARRLGGNATAIRAHARGRSSSWSNDGALDRGANAPDVVWRLNTIRKAHATSAAAQRSRALTKGATIETRQAFRADHFCAEFTLDLRALDERIRARTAGHRVRKLRPSSDCLPSRLV